MPKLEDEQLFIVQQALVKINSYSTDIAKQAGVPEAIQVMKQVMKGVKPAEPLGGSYSYPSGQKIHRLFNMFGIK